MKNWVLKTVLPAAGISILAALPCAAQTTIVPAPTAPFSLLPKRMHELPLRFVKPGVMAWWLDPQNHARPAGTKPRAQSSAIFKLPTGVERIVPIDPQNSLLVFGTEEGVRELTDTIRFLDRPQRKITVEVRLVTLKSEGLGGIWAALSGQTGRGTPAATFLQPDEELDLGGKIARREARFERTQLFSLDSGAAQTLDFGPPSLPSPLRPRDFSSQMPVIPPPITGDEMRTMRPAPRALSPFNALQLQVQPTLQSDGAVSLELRDLERGEVLGRAATARFELRAGDTLALALPDSTPGTRAFLLFTANLVQSQSASRIPLLGDLPMIGELFRSQKAPPGDAPQAP